MAERDIQRDEQAAATAESAFDAQIMGRIKNLHTCMPGIVASFDPVTQTAQVQPAIKRIFTEQGPVNLPLCVDVPVEFPGGGDFFLTFPVKPGDECILLFSERAIDNWHAFGSTQPPAEYRIHDLSDGMALVGINSQPRKIPNFAASDVELRSRDRSVRVTMKPDGTIENVNASGSTILSAAGKFTINAPGGFEVNAPTANIKAAATTMTGTAAVQGLLTASAGASVTGALTNNSKNIGSTHTHGGVQTGPGNTGAPN